MDRKGIFAVILCMAILVGWQYKTRRDVEAWQKAHPQPAAETAQTGAEPPPSPTPAQAAAATPAPSAAPEPEVPEELVTVSTPDVEYVFTSRGGGIARLTLLKHQGEKPGEPMVLNTHGLQPIGAVLDDPASEKPKSYSITRKGGEVVLERTEPNGLRVTKTFTLPTSERLKEYNVGLKIAFANTGTAQVEKAGYYLFAGTLAPVQDHELPVYTGMDWYRNGKATFVDLHWFDAKRIPLIGVERAPARPVYLETPGSVTWAGVKNQYFTSLLSTEGTPALGVWAERLNLKLDSREVQGIAGALAMPGFKLEPGKETVQAFTLYAGPKEYRRLKALGDGEAEMMNFGMFKVISVVLLRSMNWLEGWLHSYALAIIVLTFIVRGALWPVQGKATASMKKMSLVQPKMAELKEKYKDDPARMNQEVMKMYKEYGINPFAGCLPMLIQVPIFFGFYSMLGTAVELRNSHFLWVADLSRPDTVFHLLGFPINILPLLMAATMVWQMQLTPRSGDAMQQRMFMFMPLIFVVFTYNFASALALYYTVQNILSIVQLYVTRNQAAPELVKVSRPAAKKKR